LTDNDFHQKRWRKFIAARSGTPNRRKGRARKREEKVRNFRDMPVPGIATFRRLSDKSCAERSQTNVCN